MFVQGFQQMEVKFFGVMDLEVGNVFEGLRND
jgi:hypothetical protein